MLTIGCHLSSSKGYLAMGKEAVSIGANTFAFFTRNPRGSKAKPEDPAKIAAALEKLEGFVGVSGPVKFDGQHNPIKAAVIIELKDGKQTFRTKVNP